MKDAEPVLLLPRMGDLYDAAQKNGFAAGDFLSPAEQAYLQAHAAKEPVLRDVIFFGGYPEAERRVALFRAKGYRAKGDSAQADIDWENIDFEKDNWWEVPQSAEASDEPDLAETEIAVLCVSVPKGAEMPSHRDFLGSLLALGLERRVVGDIVPFRGSVYLFVKESIASYVMQNLQRVANSPVRLQRQTLPSDFAPERTLQRIDLTACSLRADAMVAAIFGCSREEAKSTVQKGLFYRNHLPLCQPEATLCEGDLLSVKGKGRYRLEAVAGQTKKGRLKIVLQKYV